MKTIRDYKQTLNEKWCIHLDSFDPDDEANQETIYTLANGYMGIRGCLELQGLKKQPGTYIAGLFDKKETSDCCSAKPSLAAKNKAITPAYAIVPDANLIAITVDGVPFDFINCKVVDFSRVLDMYNGYVINEYTLENYKGQIISLKTLSIVSKKYLHSALFKFEIVPLNFAGNIIVSFKNTLCLTPQYIARLKDYICRTELISADEIAGSCVVKAKVVETDAEIVLKAKTVGSGKRFIAKKQDGIDEIFNIAAEQGKNYSFNKFICYTTSQDDLTVDLVDNEEEIIETHINYWHQRWEIADVNIDGDDDVLIGVRWNIFNLIQLENPYDTNVSIAATGLHGQGYFGHAFWDTEIFMLPFYLATNPEEAKCLLLYRYYRLNEAREAAKERGYLGAKYPWTSAYTGKDVTPPTWERCANRQIHISGDVAYAFYNYFVQTGDKEFYNNYALEVIIETAKYYASRATKEADGKYHILDVIGPDEYNIHADDNYYTNHLVAWNIRTALSSMEKLQVEDKAVYDKITLATGFNNETIALLNDVVNNLAFPKISNNVCEQYSGFFDLKDGAEIERDEFGMPKNKDNCVYWSGEQVLKQADVVMMHYLFPDDFSEDIKRESFAYYEKRCKHGSSLSPSIHCMVGLRHGFATHAYSYLYLTALMDLKNLHIDKNISTGLHAACAGGTWAAIVYGFGGLQFKNGNVHLNPYLPEKWKSLKYTFINHGIKFNIAIQGKTLTIVADHDSVIYAYGKKYLLKAGEQKIAC